MAYEDLTARRIAQAKRTVNGTATSEIEAAVQSYLDKQFSGLFKDFARIKEKLEVIGGERGDAQRSKAAVLREDLLPLVDLPKNPSTKTVSAAPTDDDFNALVKDVRALWAKVAYIASLLEAKNRV